MTPSAKRKAVQESAALRSELATLSERLVGKLPDSVIARATQKRINEIKLRLTALNIK